MSLFQRNQQPSWSRLPCHEEVHDAAVLVLRAWGPLSFSDLEDYLIRRWPSLRGTLVIRGMVWNWVGSDHCDIDVDLNILIGDVPCLENSVGYMF